MNPIVFNFGPLLITPSGILTPLALFVFMFAFWYRCHNHKLSDDDIFDLLVILLVGSLIIGRLQFVFFHFDKFSPNILRVFLFLKYPGFGAGFVMITGLVLVYWFSIKRKIPVFLILDQLCVGATLGLLFSSLGFFLSGVGAGIPTLLPWAVTFPGQIDRRHPLSLYEVFIFLFLTLLFFWVVKLFPNRQNGILTFLFAWFYGLFLFAVEFFRIDGIYSIFGIRIGYLIGLLMILTGAIMLSKKGFFALIRTGKKLHFSIKNIKDSIRLLIERRRNTHV